MQTEVSFLLENETPKGQGTHVIRVLGDIGFELPHSVERPCPGGQSRQSIHEAEPFSYLIKC